MAAARQIAVGCAWPVAVGRRPDVRSVGRREASTGRASFQSSTIEGTPLSLEPDNNATRPAPTQHCTTVGMLPNSVFLLNRRRLALNNRQPRSEERISIRSCCTSELRETPQQAYIVGRAALEWDAARRSSPDKTPRRCVGHVGLRESRRRISYWVGSSSYPCWHFEFFCSRKSTSAAAL